MNLKRKSLCSTVSLWAWLLLLSAQGCLPQTGDHQALLPDLRTYPQTASFYAPQAADYTDSPIECSRRKHIFLSRYFRPWHIEHAIHSRAELFWPLQTEQQQFFAENTLPRSGQWLASLAEKADLQTFPSLNQPGVTLTNTNLRALPTRKPAFHDFRQAGEGFPFDYFQNSALWAGTPVHILHATTSRDWLLVETDWVFGWVPSRDIALVDADFIQSYQSKDLAAFIQDRTPVIDRQAVFRFSGHIGGLLPLVQSHNRSAEVLVPVADADRRAKLRTARLEPGSWTAFPMPATGSNLARVADQLLGQTYGWGGLYENRDCSALTRDFYTPFAIWLPRNSSQQARVPGSIPLDHLQSKEKERRILEQGLPFVTLIWMPGHVMIYIGSLNNRPLVMHAMWGLKTWTPFQGEGRYVVGRSVITSLRPGRGLPARLQPKTALIERVQGMSLLLY